MIVLGIDPGTRITGYGVLRVDGNRYLHIDNGCIAPSPSAEMPQRLVTILTKLEELITTFSPEAVAVERVFFAKNVASALKLGQCRGLALAAAGRHEIPVFEYSATQIKQAVTGYGRSGKEQIQKMVRMLLGLPEIAQSDAADALAIALCHAQSYPMAQKMAPQRVAS
jgi:crossover junction endodeoxyribonuclease RuvC